jgi:CheY-like chemotaxis protein
MHKANSLLNTLDALYSVLHITIIVTLHSKFPKKIDIFPVPRYNYIGYLRESRMTVREKLLEITGLNIANKLMVMGDNELNGYVQVLTSFVEKFPAHELSIRNALENKDYPSLSENLAVIKDMLVQIHANTLANDCLKQINGTADARHDKIEASTTFFMSMLTMLSIDIQMAIFKEEHGGESRQPIKIEYGSEAGEKSILAVDDNAFFLEMLSNILFDSKYKLTCVISSRDALKFLANHDPDLFILDIEMPQLNGYELAKKIREYGHLAPIIYMTANATKEYLLKAVQSGAADFIAKPPHKEYVLARIAKYI